MICRDIDALNLRPFQPNESKKSKIKPAKFNKANNTPPINCPLGTKAVEKKLNSNVSQSPKYGGPLVGGVLKNFPASNRSKCPAGMTEIEVNLLGKTESTCVPNQLCSDPNLMRNFLYELSKAGAQNKKLPKNWQDLPEDNVLRRNLDMIETAVCIKVSKNMRPISPYPSKEDCIDCNVLAMNDTMTKLLSKSVAPSQNPLQAFGLSNRWGPRFTFDLNVLTKIKTGAVKEKLTSKKAKENTDQLLLQLKKKSESKVGNTVNTNQSGQNILDRITSINQQKKGLLYDQLKIFQLSSTAAADQNADLINNALLDFKGSFDRIQTIYDQLVTSVEFGKKKQCTF